jgi:hypothetical protein
MIQIKSIQKSKRPEWSIYVVVKYEGYEGRVFRRNNTRVVRSINNVPKLMEREFLYLHVTNMYKKKNLIYIIVGNGKNKEIHVHEVPRIKILCKREYKREGIQ